MATIIIGRKNEQFGIRQVLQIHIQLFQLLRTFNISTVSFTRHVIVEQDDATHIQFRNVRHNMVVRRQLHASKPHHQHLTDLFF